MKSHHLTKKGEIGIVFNTDGVSPLKSSLLTIWPIFLYLINLPPRVRTLKRNIVTCLFWVGKSKPPMSLFLGHFKKMLDKVNTTGLVVKTPNGTKTFFLKPLFGVFDLVAKAPILNMNQFNGKNGCPSCLHPGIRIGHTQTYPPGIEYTLRTTDSIKLAAAKTERDKTVVEGIKGRTILASMVDLAAGAPTDYMHCVLEGVVKRLLEHSVSSTFKPYYLSKRKIERIDESFTVQCPPHDFSRVPRSIQRHRKFWKASEYRNWLLFYSLPLLVGFLPPLYIHHFALLVCALHILLQPNLTQTRITAAEMMLKDFVVLLPELYDQKECTLNSHLLLHLGEHTRLWGPLWGFSAFAFEHKNGYLMDHVHSPHKVADQLLFSLHLNQRLDSLQDELLSIESERVLSFLGLSNTDSQQKHGQLLFPGSYVVGNTYTSVIGEGVQGKIRHLIGDCPREACSFSRVYHQENIFHSLKYGRSDGKRNSTVCYRWNGTIWYN